MTLTRSLIFAVLFYLLSPMAIALAEEASSETAIMRASQSHLGASRAAADFQKSQSQLAAESLIKTIQDTEKTDPVAEQAAAITPAAAPLPQLNKPAFTIQNDLIAAPAQNSVSRAISRLPARSVSSPTYNQ